MLRAAHRERLLHNAEVSDTQTNGVSRDGQTVRSYDNGHGPEAKRILRESAVALRRSADLCSTTRADGTRQGSCATCQISENSTITRGRIPATVGAQQRTT